MTFNNPDAWWWLLLAVPLIVLYAVAFLRRRRVVATDAIWKKALARRTPWARWRKWASLTIHLVLLIALIAALAWPASVIGLTSRRSVVVVVDCSASMNASDVTPSRFALARADAWRLIDALDLGERAAVISAASRPRVLCGLTDDHPTLEDAIKRLAATDGPADVGAAIRLARRLFRGDDPDQQIILLTDGAFDLSLDESASDESRLQVRMYGNAGENVAITEFDVRPRYDVADRYDALVAVENFSDEPSKVSLQLGSTEQQQPPIELELAPRSSTRRTIAVSHAAGGLLTARIDAEDFLAVNNLVQVVAPPRRMLKIRLEGRENASLRAALQSLPTVQLADTGESEADLVILNEPTGGSLPALPVVVIAPTDSNEWWQSQSRVDVSAVGRAPADSPWLEGVDWPSLLIDRAMRVEFTAKGKAAADIIASTSSGDPLIAFIDRENAPIALVAFRLGEGATNQQADTDLSLRDDLPVLLANIVQQLSFGGGASLAFRAGDVTSIAAAGESPTVLSPAGRQVATGEGAAPLVSLDSAGVWKVRPKEGTGEQAIAVNLLDRNESNIRPRIDAKSAELDFSPKARIPLWLYLVGVALILIAVDWTLFRRRVVE